MVVQAAVLAPEFKKLGSGQSGMPEPLRRVRGRSKRDIMHARHVAVMGERRRSMAVLIDAENTQQLPYIERVLAEAARHGSVSIRRSYGRLEPAWENCFRIHDIKLVQPPDYEDYRNAADRALMADAREMLSSGKADGFCLAASDGDYAPLIKDMRKEGAFVVVIGGRGITHHSLLDECDVFKYVEDLPLPTDPDGASSGWKETVRRAIRSHAADGEWVELSVVWKTISWDYPDFNPHDYCHMKPKSLVESCPEEFETRIVNGVHVRIKPAPAQRPPAPPGQPCRPVPASDPSPPAATGQK